MEQSIELVAKHCGDQLSEYISRTERRCETTKKLTSLSSLQILFKDAFYHIEEIKMEENLHVKQRGKRYQNALQMLSL